MVHRYIPPNSKLVFDIEVLGKHGKPRANTNSGEQEQEQEHGHRQEHEQKVALEVDDAEVVPPLPVEDSRAQAVLAAFQHAFDGYEQYAWGADEFKPRSGQPKNGVWGGMGMMILDATDTAMIMGLERQVEKCLRHIDQKIHFGTVNKVSFFETTIRALGGLLGAYAMGGGSGPGVAEAGG